MRSSNSALLASVQSGNIPREFDRGALHAQAEAEERDLVFPCIPNRGDFAFNPACAESAGNQNAIGFAQDALGALPFDFFRLDPVNIHARFMVDAAMHQRFRQTLVAFLQAGIFADQRDGDFMLGMFDLLHHRIPFAKVRRTGFQMQQADDQLIQALPCGTRSALHRWSRHLWP